MLNQLLKSKSGGNGVSSGSEKDGIKRLKQSFSHPISFDDRKHFVALLSTFVNEATETLQKVDREVFKSTASASDLASYFGEPSNIGVSKVFNVLIEFANGFIKVSIKLKC